MKSDDKSRLILHIHYASNSGYDDYDLFMEKEQMIQIRSVAQQTDSEVDYEYSQSEQKQCISNTINGMMKMEYTDTVQSSTIFNLKKISQEDIPKQQIDEILRKSDEPQSHHSYEYTDNEFL